MSKHYGESRLVLETELRLMARNGLRCSAVLHGPWCVTRDAVLELRDPLRDGVVC